MKTIIQDKIDNYLLGKMSDDERKSFETELEADPDLKKDFLFAKALKEELGCRAKQEEQLSQWDKEIEHSAAQASGAKRKWIYAVTSLAAIAIFGFFFTFPKSDISDTMNKESIRGTDTHFADIVSLIENHQYEDALSVIKDKETENEGLINYYESLSSDSKNINDDEKTRMTIASEDTTNLEEVQEMLDEALNEQAELKWLKAQAYIGLGKIVTAIELLEDIRKSDFELKQKADSLYKAINHTN